MVEKRVPRVVVIGAGMAGLAAVRALRRSPVSVLLIDAHNYTTFPPLLFQVATCFISPAEVARPVRAALHGQPRAEFRLGRVTGIDFTGRRVHLDDGDDVPYDYLVLAAGVVPAFAGVPGASRYAIPLRSVNDATTLRNSLLRSFEHAAARATTAGQADTRVVVVGGGPTGVELSGYVTNFLFRHQFARDYPQLDPSAMQLTLVEHGDRLIPGFHPKLSAYALRILRARGVKVRLQTDVVEVDRDGVSITGGERLPAATVVWAGGVDAPAWAKASRLAVDHGRVTVGPDLRAAGLANVFVVGDLAAVTTPTGQLRPQLAQVAIQSGRHAGRQLDRLIAGQPTTPFSYLDKGMMAIVGRNAAIIQVARLRVTGLLAWIAWGVLHLGYLPGAASRMTAGLKYLWWHVSHENANRVLIEPEPTARTADVPSQTIPPPAATQVAERT
jgi:NADH:ubiquinone reductase (H+-translocating)